MSIESVLAALRGEYAAELDTEIGRLLEQLENGDATALRTAHRIAGTAGSYGFEQIATVARAIEMALEAASPVPIDRIKELQALRPQAAAPPQRA
jgi:HPt (histidine-containing phosphotransfer) domain-containing protein